jgi:hypothetical protein
MALIISGRFTFSEPAMSTLSANDLKTGGIAAIEAALSGQPEAIISVRGKERFVVMDVAHYHYLRECELDAALAQSQADVAAGRFVTESAQAHAQRLDALLAASEPAPEPLKPVKKTAPRRKG